MGPGVADGATHWLQRYDTVVVLMIGAKDRVEHFTRLLARQYQALDKFQSGSTNPDSQYIVKAMFEAGALTMMLRVEQLIAKVEMQLESLDPMTPLKVVALQTILYELARSISELPQSMTTGE